MHIHLYEIVAETKHEYLKQALDMTLKVKFPDANYDLEDVFQQLIDEYSRSDLKTWEEIPSHTYDENIT